MAIKKINAPVAVAGSSLGLLFFFFFFLSVMNTDGSLSLVLEWDLTSRVGVDLSFPLVLDFISSSFVSVVLYISACVTVFSGFYMAHESFLSRFICLLMSFVLSMVLLILFPSFLGLMVGWDGLGVTSFLLVVYYMDWDCLSAGMITALSNRVGDMFFVLGIACMSFSMSYGVVDIFYLKSLFSYTPVLILGVLIMLGSMTKSAVMPFSAWLPEAMAAPTPVSSLVHSSTLVTAGVYVLIRFGAVCGAFCSYFLMAFSLMTVVMAGMSAVSLVDAKKVVALSTLSQVSLMMLAISVGAVGVAFFHLLVHAFFKALMFLCLGSVIFYSGGVQDVRFLGSLMLKMPLVFVLLLISNLALVGFPFLSGYYSKELIVGSCLVGYSSAFSFFLVYLVLVLTFAYSGRMIWLLCTFQDVGAVSSYKSESIHLNTSLLLMSFGAIFSGLVGQSFMIKMNFFSPVFSLSFWGGLLLVGLWVLNMLVMFWLLEKNLLKEVFLGFVGQLWFLKPLSGSVSSTFFLSVCRSLMMLLDMGWIRGYVWKGGLKKAFVSSTGYVRSWNFSPMGVLLFCSMVLIWVFLITI